MVSLFPYRAAMTVGSLSRGERVGVSGYGLSMDRNPSPGSLPDPTSPLGRGEFESAARLDRATMNILTAAPCAARRRAAPLRRSGTDCRSYAALMRRIHRPARAGAEKESRRRASPAPPAANWPAAA